MVMTNVPSQFATPAAAIAYGRGPCRNNSDPIIIGMGPRERTTRLWIAKQKQKYIEFMSMFIEE